MSENFENFNERSLYKKNILEIGFGDGENLISNALNNLDSFYVGIEVYEAGVAKVLELIKKNNLENIFLIQGDAKAILEKNTTIKFFDEVIIFFPDPWPKKKHLKRRLINENFIDLLSKKLKKNGEFVLATDSHSYYCYALDLFSSRSDFYRMDSQEREVTKYEQRALNLGNEVHDVTYKLSQQN